MTECPECGGPLRKVYGNVGIVLKGSGFYKTDSRAAASRANGSGEKAAEKSSAESSGTDSTPQKETAAAGSKDSGGDAKPAATAAS